MPLKSRKVKYFLVTLEERNGEREYYHRQPVKISPGQDIAAEADRLAGEWYDAGDPSREKADNGYYFQHGQVHVSADYWKPITRHEYTVLKKFL